MHQKLETLGKGITVLNFAWLFAMFGTLIYARNQLGHWPSYDNPDPTTILNRYWDMYVTLGALFALLTCLLAIPFLIYKAWKHRFVFSGYSAMYLVVATFFVIDLGIAPRVMNWLLD